MIFFSQINLILNVYITKKLDLFEKQINFYFTIFFIHKLIWMKLNCVCIDI